MRRQRSDLYQVDFMAALFGGFVLVWLSGQGALESPQAGQRLPVFFSLTARLVYSLPGEAEASISVLPEDAIDTACVPANWLRMVFGTHPEFGICKGTPTSEERTPEPYSVATVHTAIAADHTKQTEAGIGASPPWAIEHEFVKVGGIDLSFSPGQDNATEFPAIIGRVIAKIRSPAAQVGEYEIGRARVASDSQQVLIGVVPSTWRTVPKIVVQNPEIFHTLVYSETANGQGDAEYRYKIGAILGHDPNRRAPHRLEILVHWDVAGRNLCYARTVKIPDETATKNTFDLHPCVLADGVIGSP